MNKKIFYVILLSVYSFSQAKATKVDKPKKCILKLEKVKHSEGKLHLTIDYTNGCEVSMQSEDDKIVFSTQSDIGTKSTDNNASNNDTNDTKIETLIGLAKSKIGSSYLYAAAGPDHFDCSGFVYYVYKENGIKIPRTSLNQSKSGDKLTRDEIKRGDILFFDTHDRKHVNHSGVYLGDGKFIHSSSGKAHGVTISDLDHGFYKDKFRWGVRKF